MNCPNWELGAFQIRISRNSPTNGELEKALIPFSAHLCAVAPSRGIRCIALEPGMRLNRRSRRQQRPSNFLRPDQPIEFHPPSDWVDSSNSVILCFLYFLLLGHCSFKDIYTLIGRRHPALGAFQIWDDYFFPGPLAYSAFSAARGTVRMNGPDWELGERFRVESLATARRRDVWRTGKGVEQEVTKATKANST